MAKEEAIIGYFEVQPRSQGFSHKMGGKALGKSLFEVAREAWSFMCRIELWDCCGGSRKK